MKRKKPIEQQMADSFYDSRNDASLLGFHLSLALALMAKIRLEVLGWKPLLGTRVEADEAFAMINARDSSARYFKQELNWLVKLVPEHASRADGLCLLSEGLKMMMENTRKMPVDEHSVVFTDAQCVELVALAGTIK